VAAATALRRCAAGWFPVCASIRAACHEKPTTRASAPNAVALNGLDMFVGLSAAARAYLEGRQYYRVASATFSKRTSAGFSAARRLYTSYDSKVIRSRPGDAMTMNLGRLATLFGTLLCATVGSSTAAEPDLRLVTAAAGQDWAAVKRLLQENVDVNTPRADGATAVLWAAHWGALDMVDALLRAGASVNLADDHGVTPLSRAAENADPPLVERLLTAGANPNLAQTSGLTPLMIAAHTGNVRVAKALLIHGADVNASTRETKATALMWAVSAPHPEMVRALIEAKADVHVSSAKGLTPLLYAARNGDVEMARVLIDAGARVNDPGSDGVHALPLSIVSGHSEFALYLLEQGADANARMGGVRAIHAAAGNVGLWLEDWYRAQGTTSPFGSGGFGANIPAGRRVALIEALVGHGADVNARIETSAMFMGYIGYPTKGAFEPFSCGTGDVRGATPLWVASYAANSGGGFFADAGPAAGIATRGESATDVLRALLAAGADPHVTTVDGTTSLMVAAGLGRATFQPGLQRGRRSPSAEEAVKVLLDAGADINAVNEADFAAVHGAAFRGLNEVIQILVERGANIDARDYRGRTPYRLAEGSKQSFQFQAYPETAAFIAKLGANTRLGIPGTVHERLRDVTGFIAASTQQP
jgi:ankyrin repeat protein